MLLVSGLFYARCVRCEDERIEIVEFPSICTSLYLLASETAWASCGGDSPLAVTRFTGLRVKC